MEANTPVHMAFAMTLVNELHNDEVFLKSKSEKCCEREREH